MSDSILNCPFCNAKYSEGIKCRRCKNDLSIFILTIKDAAFHLKEAMKFEKENDYEQAFFHSKRSIALRFSPEAFIIFNKSAVVTKRFGELVWQG